MCQYRYVTLRTSTGTHQFQPSMQLSEPYTIYTYRYFLHQWPKLCYFAFDGDKAFGTVICKMDMHREHMRGYVAMLVVDKAYRGKGAGWFQS